MMARVREPSATTRYSFWLAWGITPDEQVAIESEFGKHDVPTDKTGEVTYQVTTLMPLLD
jgi:hypothetical protein